jgi:hypothetical protein
MARQFAEVDVSACHLTIYHAKIAKQPLKDDADPYASTDVPRDVAKLWVLVTFGNSEPATNWPTKIATRYKKDTGVDLNEVAKASDVGQRMLAAFPALRRLKDHVWAELQYLEAEAIIGTMLALKRDHGVRNFRLPRRRAVAVGRLGTWR